jgi:hypothetical protein
MDLVWDGAHGGGSWLALADNYLVGEVIPYGRMQPPRWVAFVRRKRVGKYATLAEAKAAVEAALSGR